MTFDSYIGALLALFEQCFKLALDVQKIIEFRLINQLIVLKRKQRRRLFRDRVTLQEIGNQKPTSCPRPFRNTNIKQDQFHPAQKTHMLTSRREPDCQFRVVPGSRRGWLPLVHRILRIPLPCDGTALVFPANNYEQGLR